MRDIFANNTRRSYPVIFSDIRSAILDPPHPSANKAKNFSHNTWYIPSNSDGRRLCPLSLILLELGSVTHIFAFAIRYGHNAFLGSLAPNIIFPSRLTTFLNWQLLGTWTNWIKTSHQVGMRLNWQQDKIPLNISQALAAGRAKRPRA